MHKEDTAMARLLSWISRATATASSRKSMTTSTLYRSRNLASIQEQPLPATAKSSAASAAVPARSFFTASLAAASGAGNGSSLSRSSNRGGRTTGGGGGSHGNNSNRPSSRNQTTTTSSSSTTSSRRGRNAVNLLPTYLADARSVERYHPTNAPNGALQLGVAESQMLEDWLVPALNHQNAAPSSAIPADAIYYQPTPGRPSFRLAMAKYMEDLLQLEPGRLRSEKALEGLVVGAGCNAVLENLCLCLADPGEAVLIPTPYYAAFEFDLVARAHLHVQAVQTQAHARRRPSFSSDSSTGGGVDPSVYYPTAQGLDAAYKAAAAAGHEPRILLLSHPHNPLGICYPPETIQECIEWCQSRKVHLVSDEIYAGSVYRRNSSSDDEGFQSILKIADKKSGGLGPYIHWVYALSKDMALSGMRVGVCYTENEEIRLPLQKLNDLCQMSSQSQIWTQDLLTRKLQDSKSGEESVVENADDPAKDDELWTQAFRRENHARLRKRSDALIACLEECDIPYLVPTAGLFCWIDLSAHLPPSSSTVGSREKKMTKAERDADDAQRERDLYLRLIHDFGLLLTPGNSMRNEQPGFFRVVFTAATDDEFALGLERIRKFAAMSAKN